MPPISPMSLWLKSKCVRVRFSFSASANALASLSVRWFASKDQIKLSQTNKYIVHLEYTNDEEGYKRAGQRSRPYSQNSGLTWCLCMAKSNENLSFDPLLGFGSLSCTHILAPASLMTDSSTTCLQKPYRPLIARSSLTNSSKEASNEL